MKLQVEKNYKEHLLVILNNLKHCHYMSGIQTSIRKIQKTKVTNI